MYVMQAPICPTFLIVIKPHIVYNMTDYGVNDRKRLI